MPNIAWQEPQIVIDLLAMNLIAARNGMEIPGNTHVAIVSPWLSDVELFLRPCSWHQQLTVGEVDPHFNLYRSISEFGVAGWQVDIGVLQYGKSPSGLTKDAAKFHHERAFLRQLIGVDGVNVYMMPDLHAKGIVTPLGIITGSTNITKSGMYAQSQNANFFAWNHADYAGNREQLLGRFGSATPVGQIP